MDGSVTEVRLVLLRAAGVGCVEPKLTRDVDSTDHRHRLSVRLSNHLARGVVNTRCCDLTCVKIVVFM